MRESNYVYFTFILIKKYIRVIEHLSCLLFKTTFPSSIENRDNHTYMRKTHICVAKKGKMTRCTYAVAKRSARYLKRADVTRP